jgi:glycine cleavage system transcriptional repressor
MLHYASALANLDHWMNQQLALTLLTTENSKILVQLTKLLATYNCQIQSSRITTLGSELGMLLLLSAPWNELAKLETHLPEFAQKHNVLLHFQRTQPKTAEGSKWIPYTVELIAHDNTGIIETIIEFFTEAGITIYEVQNNTYMTNPLNIPMFSLAMRILVPADTQLSELREKFSIVCDFLNIDAYLEPERT